MKRERVKEIKIIMKDSKIYEETSVSATTQPNADTRSLGKGTANPIPKTRMPVF